MASQNYILSSVASTPAIPITPDVLSSKVVPPGIICGRKMKRALVIGAWLLGSYTTPIVAQTLPAPGFTGVFNTITTSTDPATNSASGYFAAYLSSGNGPLQFQVTAYGAKCDGQVTLGGVSVSSGSPTINNPSHPFTAADIGATITLSVPTLNSHSSGALPSFTSTIASVSGGVATMAANSTIGATGAGARWYHTDDTAAIQAAYAAAHAAGGGTVAFPSGACATGQITFYDNTRTLGQGWNSSIVMLAAGKNSDLFVSDKFSSLVGSDNPGGIHNWSFEHIQLDGNRGANTGSGIGTATGTGDLIRAYGYEFSTDQLLLTNAAGDGAYTEWSTTAGSPLDTTTGTIGPAGMEAHPRDTKMSYNAGYGWVWNGPHDSHVSHLTMLSNGTGGFYQLSGVGSPVTMDNIHGYQEGGYDIIWSSSNNSCSQCYAEGGMLVRGFNETLDNTDIGGAGLVLGQSGDTVYRMFMHNVHISVLNNVAGTGFDDNWSQGSVASIAGAPYAASFIMNTDGLPNHAPSLGVQNNTSWIGTIAESAASEFTITNLGAIQYTNSPNGNAFTQPISSPKLIVTAMPTACSGQVTGTLANVAGVLSVCP